jgi:Domain of unknown function (DUF5615)
MKIKLDENLPLRLASLLINLGHDLHTLRDERLVGHGDREIWEASQNESRFLITQDRIFRICGSSLGDHITAYSSCAFDRQTLGTCLSEFSKCFKRKTSANGAAAL